jgi:hypothetical protein
MDSDRSMNSGSGGPLKPKHKITLICATYLLLSAIFGSMNLDVDELGFMREPYEMIGGDYTRRYLAQHDLGNAASTVARSYYFYWKYRPLNAPLIDAKDRGLFRVEEARFGYTKPISLPGWDPNRMTRYAKRLVVPEPERFYRLGAGKPLFPAVVSVPQLALLELVTSERRILVLQQTYNYHPLFILARLVQILSGLLTVLLVYRILAEELDEERALAGASVMALFPVSIMYFPNLHYDSILVPFALLAAYAFRKRQYVRSGVFFGLSLAAKNTAIFLLPVFLAYVVWQTFAATPGKATSSRRKSMLKGLRGLAITSVVSIPVLLPFANLVSYSREILTPVIEREYDPRGEKVYQYSLAEQLSATDRTAPQYEHRSIIRPEVRLMKLIGFADIGFLFFALAALMLFSRQNGAMSRLCILLLLLTIPYGLLFGRQLGYRMLMFVPFFAILAVDVARPRPLRVFLVLLVLMDVVYCLDPMTTNTRHYPVAGDVTRMQAR